MKPGGLLLALGSLVLWAPLLQGAPLKEVPGTPLPTQSSDPGAPQPSGVSPKGEAASETPLPAASWREAPLAQHSPVRRGAPGSGEDGRDRLPPTETAPAPPKKPLCKQKPRPQGSTEKPPGAPEGPLLLDRERDLGVDQASGGKEAVPAGDTSRPPGSAHPATGPASPDPGPLVREDATPGDKLIGGSGSASNIPPRNPAVGGGPASPEDQVPSAGHPAHGRPVSSGKPAAAPGNVSHATPPAGAQPATSPGPAVHREPAPHEKPAAGGKPAPAEPAEKEAGNEAAPEALEAEDQDEGGDPDLAGGSSEEDDDAFDKELDYGLNRPPFNADAYHDAWSEDDSEDPGDGLEGGPPEAAAGFGDGDTVFDAWGENSAAGALGPELQPGWFPRVRTPGV